MMFFGGSGGKFIGKDVVALMPWRTRHESYQTLPKPAVGVTVKV